MNLRDKRNDTPAHNVQETIPLFDFEHRTDDADDLDFQPNVTGMLDVQIGQHEDAEEIGNEELNFG